MIILIGSSTCATDLIHDAIKYTVNVQALDCLAQTRTPRYRQLLLLLFLFTFSILASISNLFSVLEEQLSRPLVFTLCFPLNYLQRLLAGIKEQRINIALSHWCLYHHIIWRLYCCRLRQLTYLQLALLVGEKLMERRVIATAPIETHFIPLPLHHISIHIVFCC